MEILNTSDSTSYYLSSKLWSILDKMRGVMDISSSKELFSGIFLYKYLSDNFKADKNHSGNSLYTIPADCIFEHITANPGSIFYDTLNTVFNKLESANGEKLKGIFSSMDFQFENRFGDIDSLNNMLSQILEEFTSFNLTVNEDFSQSLIGEFFQYTLDKFAEIEGKKTGEWMTPLSIRELISKLFTADLKTAPIKIYDPVCGVGGLLLEYARNSHYFHSDVKIELYGQERNLKTVLLAKINMIVNGYDASNIKYGDTILDPKHIKDGYLQKFDIVIGNPPFSASNWGAENALLDQYNRFTWGVPPKSKADYAFILHILASTNEKGKIAVVVPHGVLFREGNEGAIRRKIIEANYLDAVIVLPANLFYSSSIPVSILVLNKGRKNSEKNVLFIDANDQFVPGKRQNKLSPEHINLIVETYTRFKAQISYHPIEKTSCIVSPEEIIENEYNLNITRYLKAEEKIVKIDINQLKAEISLLEKQSEEIDKQIIALSDELFKDKNQKINI